jgi:hypothetical protein
LLFERSLDEVREQALAAGNWATQQKLDLCQDYDQVMDLWEENRGIPEALEQLGIPLTSLPERVRRSPIARCAK